MSKKVTMAELAEQNAILKKRVGDNNDYDFMNRKILSKLLGFYKQEQFLGSSRPPEVDVKNWMEIAFEIGSLTNKSHANDSRSKEMQIFIEAIDGLSKKVDSLEKNNPCINSDDF